MSRTHSPRLLTLIAATLWIVVEAGALQVVAPSLGEQIESAEIVAIGRVRIVSEEAQKDILNNEDPGEASVLISPRNRVQHSTFTVLKWIKSERGTPSVLSIRTWDFPTIICPTIRGVRDTTTYLMFLSRLPSEPDVYVPFHGTDSIVELGEFPEEVDRVATLLTRHRGLGNATESALHAFRKLTLDELETPPLTRLVQDQLRWHKDLARDFAEELTEVQQARLYKVYRANDLNSMIPLMDLLWHASIKSESILEEIARHLTRDQGSESKLFVEHYTAMRLIDSGIKADLRAPGGDEPELYDPIHFWTRKPQFFKRRNTRKFLNRLKESRPDWDLKRAPTTVPEPPIVFFPGNASVSEPTREIFVPDFQRNRLRAPMAASSRIHVTPPPRQEQTRNRNEPNV